MYRILDTATGLYYAGGGSFSKYGKAYFKKHHLTAALVCYTSGGRYTIPDTWIIVEIAETVIARHTVDVFTRKEK